LKTYTCRLEISSKLRRGHQLERQSRLGRRAGQSAVRPDQQRPESSTTHYAKSTAGPVL